MPKTKKKPETMLVRIHPPDRKRGFAAETFIMSGSGYPKFDWKLGWYEVDRATAEVLATKKNNPNLPSSNPIFQICTHEEARALDIAEKQEMAKADAPVPMPRRAHRVEKAEAKAASKRSKADEDLDLSDEDDDEDWEELTKPENEQPRFQETADDEDLADLDELVGKGDKEATEGDAKAAPKKATKKRRSAKKSAKKRGS